MNPQPDQSKKASKKLLKARAHLAYVEALPLSSFEPMFKGAPGYPYTGPYSVDIKADTIARARASVKRLEVLDEV